MTNKSIKDMLCFQGQWRSYQKRVLDRADRYLADKKIHIVAAPGSGKTTLGIELIRRLDAPALILSPSINIRNQWLARIKEAYLPSEVETAGILSNSMKKPALLNAITYQALHSCMTKKVLEEEVQLVEAEAQSEKTESNSENGEIVPKEAEDYREFDFFAVVKEAGIKTLCLDEAHHLRSEWWKALEELVKREPDMTVISLTATPPYDSTKAEWDRYVALCGPIDEEIIVPELVKEGSLCPHQDYVYFNMPTEEEEEAVINFRRDAVEVGTQILQNQEFALLVSKHKGILNPKEHMEELLERPEYLSSILVFLNEKQMPFSQELVKMLGAKEQIPKMNLRWLEILLQGFLYDDIESYPEDSVFREQMTELLKGRGLIQKRKVSLTGNEDVNKLLRTSKGKISSIVTLVGAEYRNMGQELRLLVLTDYIKKEYMSALGDQQKAVNELGVVPIFENIRRAYEADGVSEQLRLAALSGSVVIVPASAKPVLETILAEKNVKAAIKECGAAGYYQVTVSGTEETASGLVTELFNRGEIRVLIGTKSLLGEGWDSPCINSLILASFVGSFMLSNQMRGRAIRTMKGNPDKVSNIWHLICMESKGIDADGNEKEPEESEDFVTLKRRFEGFLGVNYKENIIENGLERLSFIQPPYTKKHLEEINQQMLAMAAERSVLKKRWEDSLVVMNKMEVAVEAGADKEHFKPGIRLANTMAVVIVIAVLAIIGLLGFAGMLGSTILSGAKLSMFKVILFVVIEAILIGLGAKYGSRLASLATPFRYMRNIGKGMLKALQQLGSIQSDKVAVEVEDSGSMCYVYLKGGTEREKDVFAQCVSEFFGIVDNQRYILKAKGRVNKLCRYYCVPEVFGKRKEDAQMLVNALKKQIGEYQLYYTRNPEGRKILLEARVHAFANKNERCVDARKKVKGAYQ